MNSNIHAQLDLLASQTFFSEIFFRYSGFNLIEGHDFFETRISHLAELQSELSRWYQLVITRDLKIRFDFPVTGRARTQHIRNVYLL